MKWETVPDLRDGDFPGQQNAEACHVLHKEELTKIKPILGPKGAAKTWRRGGIVRAQTHLSQRSALKKQCEPHRPRGLESRSQFLESLDPFPCWTYCPNPPPTLPIPRGLILPLQRYKYLEYRTSLFRRFILHSTCWFVCLCVCAMCVPAPTETRRR